MTLKEKQLKALDESIKHWERNCIRASENKMPEIGYEYCECCIKFDQDGDCCECPISEAGGILCDDTPYYDVLNTLGSSHDVILDACLIEYMYLLNVREYLLS